MTSLEQARKRIDETDAKMAELFCARMQAAAVVGSYKQQHGLQIYDAVREAEVIRRNAERIEDKTIREYYVRFLSEIMALSRDYQERLRHGMKVAYSGTEGAFAHIAACKLFPAAQKVSYPDFAAAYDAVQNGECDVAVLPTENSYNGEVGQVTDLMFSGPLYVNYMTELSVTQDLLALPGAALEDIQTVVSHPQALGQCAEYIAKNGFATQEYNNTALAARYVVQRGDKSVAAIASAEAAELLGLQVLEKNINASRHNTTKFAVFSRANNDFHAGERGVHTVLMFTVRNEAGALAQAIDIIGRHGFNMLTLRSRNMKELLWQYYFFVEVEGDIGGENGKEMLSELRTCCDKLKVAGSFKKETIS